MGSRQKFRHEQIEEALRNSGGIFTIAAIILKCAPNTVKNYVGRSKRLQRVLAEVSEQVLDIAEAELMKKIKGGHIAAIIFYLKTKGKARGYIERSEIGGPDGAPVMSPIVILPSNGRDENGAADDGGGEAPTG